MDILPKNATRRLLDAEGEPCVSIFMETHRVMKRTPEDPIHFSNLLARAERELTDQGMTGPEAANLLRLTRNYVGDPSFWQHQDRGLAVFVNPAVSEYFSLPINPGEKLVVGDHFYLKPLLQVLVGGGHFYVLALGRREVRLLMGTRYGLNDAELQSPPEGIEETVDHAGGPEQLRFHRTIQDRAGIAITVFHGPGVAPSDTRDTTLRYFKEIAKELRDVLRQEKAPLVLAGEVELQELYKGGNSYPHLVEGPVGNPDDLTPEQLHERAWSLVEPLFRRAEQEAVRRYGDGLSRGLSSTSIREIVAASQEGKVDSLFVAGNVSIWGTLDDSKGVAAVHQERQPGDVDLLDRSALNTFCTDGSLYVRDRTEMPDSAALAATFRY